jgi:hypothetical protein
VICDSCAIASLGGGGVKGDNDDAKDIAMFSAEGWITLFVDQLCMFTCLLQQ